MRELDRGKGKGSGDEARVLSLLTVSSGRNFLRGAVHSTDEPTLAFFLSRPRKRSRVIALRRLKSSSLESDSSISSTGRSLTLLAAGPFGRDAGCLPLR